jgi:pimeloyl-ACP methyl ester carboxylesterase
VDRYTQAGYRLIARSWPGMEGDIDALRADPSAIEHLGITEIADHYDGIVRELGKPPIIMGHSFGGAFTQLQLDRGLGVAGVAIDSAAVKGILTLPLSTLRSGFPVLRSPANNHKAVMLSPEEFHYAFANTMSAEAALAVYQRYAVPGPGHVLFQAALANFNPHAATRVDFLQRRARATLAHRRRRRPRGTIRGRPRDRAARRQIQRRDGVPRISGPFTQHHWPDRLEEVADYALAWAVEHARSATAEGAIA